MLDWLPSGFVPLQWNLSFSISDLLSLVLTLVTVWLAYLTWNIQAAQKNFIEQQTSIMEQQHEFAKQLNLREENEFKSTVIEHATRLYNCVIDKHVIFDEESELFFSQKDYLIKEYYSGKLEEALGKLNEIYLRYKEVAISRNTDDEKVNKFKELMVEMVPHKRTIQALVFERDFK